MIQPLARVRATSCTLLAHFSPQTTKGPTPANGVSVGPS